MCWGGWGLPRAAEAACGEGSPPCWPLDAEAACGEGTRRADKWPAGGAAQKRGEGAGRGWLRGLGGQASTKTNMGGIIKRWPSGARGGNDPTPAASGLRVGYSEGRGGRAQRITNNIINNQLANIGQTAQGFTNRN